MEIIDFRGFLTDVSPKTATLSLAPYTSLLLVCIFLQQYRIHMDIGNSKNYLAYVPHYSSVSRLLRVKQASGTGQLLVDYLS